MVRPLRLLVAASLMVGCSYQGDAPVYGLSFRASRDDLRAATAVARAGNPQRMIYSYRVISGDEIWLYDTDDRDGGYLITQRINGKWQCREKMFVIRLHD